MLFQAVLAIGMVASSEQMACPEEMFGTWGISRKDREYSSYLSLYMSGRGETIAEIDLQESSARCDARKLVSDDTRERWIHVGIPVERKAGGDRYEWVQNPTDAAAEGEVCWLRMQPQGEKVLADVHCPSICPETKPVLLDHFANVHLVPPIGVSVGFCVSDDRLRQKLCVPGSLRADVERARAASEKLHGLVESSADEAKINDAWDWKLATTLLTVIDTCRAQPDAVECLARRIKSAGDDLQTRVEQQERRIEAERAVSQARQVDIGRAEVRKEWEGEWRLSNPVFASTLQIERCAEAGCVASLGAETNYTFGAGRKGFCAISTIDIAFTSESTAFGYEYRDGNSSADDPRSSLVNYCRVDLRRTMNGVDVSLHGVGCGEGCMNVARQSELMEGSYTRPGSASYDCKRDWFEELGWDEQMICLDEQLAASDRELDEAYRHALAHTRADQRSALVREQRQWLEQRREGCEPSADVKACIREAYATRLGQLAK